MLLWRIYYDDGTTYDNLDGPPEEAPRLGVQAVVTLHNLWYGGDRIGYLDYMFRPGWKIVLFGRLIDNEKYAKIKKQALSDTDFPMSPPKEARHVYFGQDYFWWNGGDV